MATYTFGKVSTHDFATTIERVTAALAAQGFGVLTDIDFAGTLKKKIDKTIPPYRILGACNPQFAGQAVDAEPAIGALLPCNVVVRQDDQGHIHVEMMDPNAVLGLIDGDGIDRMATEVRGRLEAALANV